MHNIVRINPDIFELKAKYRTADEELATLRRDFNRTKNNAAGGRADINSNPTAEDLDTWSFDQRDRLVQGTKTLDDSKDLLLDARRIAAQTEEIGIEIVSDLDGQHKKLDGVNTGINEIETNLGQTKKVLVKMYFNVLSKKLFMGIIIIAEIITILILIYFAFVFPHWRIIGGKQ